MRDVHVDKLVDGQTVRHVLFGVVAQYMWFASHAFQEIVDLGGAPVVAMSRSGQSLSSGAALDFTIGALVQVGADWVGDVSTPMCM